MTGYIAYKKTKSGLVPSAVGLTVEHVESKLRENADAPPTYRRLGDARPNSGKYEIYSCEFRDACKIRRSSVVRGVRLVKEVTV